MTAPRIEFVVAMAENRVIGKNCDLPWRLPADLARFKSITQDGIVVMGRRTHESLPGPLPGRRSIVLTHRAGYRAAGCETVMSPRYALRLAEGASRVFVIGGAAVYAAFADMAEVVHATIVETNPEGDVLFPDLGREIARKRIVGRHERDERNEHAMRFEEWIMEPAAAEPEEGPAERAETQTTQQ